MSNHSNGSINDIEREIDQDRSHLAETLTALENKFSPGQVVDQVLGYAKRNGGDFSDNLVKTVANNPLPTILTGIGLTWMAFNQGRKGSPYDRDGAYPREPEGADGAARTSDTKNTVGGMAHRAASKAGDAASEARHMIGGFRESASSMMAKRQEQWQHTSQGAREFFEQNPLAVGAAAVAAGALIGSFFRASTTETEMLGESGEQLKEKAQSLANEQAKQSTQSKPKMETH